MLSERLEIERSLIRVDYVFENQSTNSIKTVVSFPIPELETDLEYNPAERENDALDKMNFQAWVDGKRVKIRTAYEVFADKKPGNQAALLQKHEMFIEDATKAFAQFKKLEKIAQKELLDSGLCRKADWGDNEHYYCLWKFRKNFYWEQIFPPGKQVKVRHQYKPVRGLALYLSRVLDQGEGWIQTYCIEKDVQSWLQKTLQGWRGAGSAADELETVEYIFKTGATWKGPIRDFHLVLKKPNIDSRISVCFDGLKNTGPTTFEARLKDLTPKHDLKILFLDPARERHERR